MVLALVIAAVQSVVPMLGAAQNRDGWMLLSRRSAVTLCGLLSISFFSMVYAYALSDFSVLNVFQNSHTMKPWLYKLAGVWSNHEGSMLLWAWMLTFWGFMVVRHSKKLPLPFLARVLSVQGMICFGFLLFILLTSNPFLRLVPAAPEGLGLNPLLQDPALAVHPPLLYTGYVGFSIAFCFAAAALIEKRVDAAWAGVLRPWVLAAWIALTAGITVGAGWAYYELGWGGFWFWDPVENASLMPWLAGTALLHSVVALEKRNVLKSWTVFLSIFAFSLSLLGTFLVRSGILTSVHAFATDPARGIFILALLAITIGGALLLYALRAPFITIGAGFQPVSRETVILLNNVFLFTFAATVFVGTLYPVFLSALNLGSISVGPPYYTAVMLPLLVPFALLMGVAPALSWRQSALAAPLKKLWAPLLGAALIAGAVGFSGRPEKVTGVVMFFVAGWIALSTLQNLLEKTGGLRRWRNLPLSYFGMIAAHTGFAVLLMGVTAATCWKSEKTLWMTPGQHISFARHDVLFMGVVSGIGSNYDYDRAMFTVSGHDDPGRKFVAAPEKRWYPVAGRMMSETALHLSGPDVFYLVMGGHDENDSRRWVVRMYYHPLISLIFGGAYMIALGGALALFDRRRKADMLKGDAPGAVTA
jgi:cytochrome c-type biogenesis protein CcmF